MEGVRKKAKGAEGKEPKRRGAAAAATKEAILTAAEALFGRVGFDAATTREISESAGMNKALIHYHFKSKEDLLTAVLDRHYGRLQEALLAAVSKATTVEERLRRALEAYVDFLAAHHNVAMIIQREISAGKNVDKIWGRTLPFFQLVTQWLEEEFPATRSGPLSAPQLLLSFYGMTVTSFMAPDIFAQVLGKDPLGASAVTQRKAHLQRMVDLTLWALASPTKSRSRR